MTEKRPIRISLLKRAKNSTKVVTPMNQALKNIATAIPPPNQPLDVPHDWSAVENKLGMMLPRDYREFISLYGSGRFEPLELFVWNLSVTKPEPDVGWLLDQHEFCHDARDRSRPTLLEFAKQTPLFPWSEGTAFETLFWAMAGSVEEWYVIVSTDGYGKYHRFPNHGTTDFLADLLLARDANLVGLWSPACFSRPQKFFRAQ